MHKNRNQREQATSRLRVTTSIKCFFCAPVINREIPSKMQKRQRGEAKEVEEVDNEVVAQPYRLDLDPPVCDVASVEIVDCPRSSQLAKEKLRPLYAPFFHEERDFDYFCMLPISSGQRTLFIQKLLQKQREQIRGAVETK